jgi:hypothetical protein
VDRRAAADADLDPVGRPEVIREDVASVIRTSSHYRQRHRRLDRRRFLYGFKLAGLSMPAGAHRQALRRRRDCRPSC